VRDRVQDRGLGHLGMPCPLRLGGLIGDPVALDRDVDQAAQRARDPFQLAWLKRQSLET
jgi:hypothetical protein